MRKDYCDLYVQYISFPPDHTSAKGRFFMLKFMGGIA